MYLLELHESNVYELIQLRSKLSLRIYATCNVHIALLVRTVFIFVRLIITIVSELSVKTPEVQRLHLSHGKAIHVKTLCSLQNSVSF